MRLTAATAGERFIPVNHCALIADGARRNEKPLTLANRASALNLRRPKTCNRGSYIVNPVTWNSGGKPVAFIAAKQELVLEVAVTNHQYEMARSRPNIQDLWNDTFETADVEELAAPVPANVNTHLHGLPCTRLLNL